jgi:hypothetical protein
MNVPVGALSNPDGSFACLGNCTSVYDSIPGDTVFITSSLWSYSSHHKTVAFLVSWGVFDSIPLSPLNSTDYNYFILLLENTSSLATACIPVNCAYLSSGTLIANNTVENNPAQVTVLEGTGGPGTYEHVITTTLANALLVTFPVAG